MAYSLYFHVFFFLFLPSFLPGLLDDFARRALLSLSAYPHFSFLAVPSF